MNSNHQLFVTSDGSHSIRIPGKNVAYHSKHGAIQESRHIYIDVGLNAVLKENSALSIFEMGFGTGLNALLTLLKSSSASSIYYETAETHPIEPSFAANINFCQILERNDLEEVFHEMHTSPWDQPVHLTSYFTLHKRQADMLSIGFDKKFHLVYFDPFDPVVQPDLWTAAIFNKIRNHMHDNGVLVTYSSKVTVQRALKDSGFAVEKIQGPRGKREVIRARCI